MTHGDRAILKPHRTGVNPDYRADIDGLRALAVIGVILWHAGFSAQGRWLLPGGFLGVDVFFVISGYLMARIWDGGISFSDFAMRRLRRILPMVFATILVCIPIAIWIMGRSAQDDFGADAMASLWLVPNIFYSFQDSYWAAPGKIRPLLHLWTIGVEMQFYLLCPLIFLAIKKWGKPVLGLSLMSVLSFAAAAWLARSYPEFAFYNLPTRLWEFGLGALVFYSPLSKIKSPVLGVLGLALILGSFIFLNEAIIHPAELTLLPVLGSCLVIAGGRVSALTILTTPFLRRIGIISFSAYLIHQPLFAFTRIVMNQIDLPFLISVGLILLAFGLSELTYRFIETPLRKPNKKRDGVVGLLGSFALAGVLLIQFSPQASVNTEALSVKPERWILEINGKRCVNRKVEDACLVGDEKQLPTVALLGDSHMYSISGAFQNLFKEAEISALDFAYAGCPFIENIERYARTDSCAFFTEGVFSKLKNSSINTVIIFDRRAGYLLGYAATSDSGETDPTDLRLYSTEVGQTTSQEKQITPIAEAQRQTILHLRALGMRIIYIKSLPEMGVNVPDDILKRIAKDNLPLTLTRQLHDQRQIVLADLLTTLNESPETLILDPADILCDAVVCFSHSDTEIFYTDRDHPSKATAQILMQDFGGVITTFIKSAQK